MKTVIPRYTFNAAAKTVTFPDFDAIRLERLALITNTTDNIIIYNFADPTKGATVSGNVLTLDYDTTGMSDSDAIRIDYDPTAADPQYERAIIGNARTKFRDGFSTEDTLQPNPDIWDLVNDDENPVTGHIITAGGNSSGSKYLRISLSPFNESSQVLLNSKNTFIYPMRVGFGLSLSQRVSGQEVFIGMVGTDTSGTIEYIDTVADKPITGTTAVVASNIATFTLANHGFKGGDRINIAGCAEKRLNVGPVVVTVLTKDTFTVPIVLANASYSTVGGFVRTVDPMRYAKNGSGLLIESTTATNASFVARRNGGKFRSTNSSIGSTTAAQTNTNPYTDAFNASNNQELLFTLDEVGYRSYAADAVSSMAGLSKYTQSVPDEEIEYKIQIRARNLNGITVPVGRITSITKTASTTATVTTDVPHGLATGDFVQVYGVRDQTNFPNLATQTVVASAPTATTFTVIIGASATASSLGGVVWQNQGSVLAPGVIATALQSISRTGNIMTVTGNATMAALLPGEYVQLHGLEPAGTAYEGAYKVLRVNTTVLELEAPGADFGSITTGGAVIRRTDVRVHFARVLDYTRLVTEVVGGRGNVNDINNSVPVSVTGSAVIPVSQGAGATATSSIWNAAGYGGAFLNDIASAAITTSVTSGAITPGNPANVGTYANSFNVVVTAVAGTNPTLDVSVEESMDNGTNWVRIYDFPRITANGAYTSPLVRAQYGTRYRYVRTVGGTSPSFTMTVNRAQFSSTPPLHRQFFDRSIVLTTLNSATPIYNVDGADKLALYINVGAVTTTAPAIQLEGSETGITTDFYPLGTPVTAVASSTVTMLTESFMPKFVRARVSTAGVGVTAGYISIKANGR